MKRFSIFFMVALLMIGLAQCKKEQTQNAGTDNRVDITLRLDQGNAKVHVTDEGSTAPVTYDAGDVILVGSNGKYVGKLFCEPDLTTFTGNLNADYLTSGKPLQFIFVGKQTLNLPAEGGSTSFTFSLADQSAAPAVFATAPSFEDYASDLFSYTAYLKNRSALVKFAVDPDVPAVTICNLTNSLSVSWNGDVTSNGTGDILTHGTGAVRYAVVAEDQAAISGGMAEAAACFSGTFTIPTAAYPNAYITTASMELTQPEHEYVDLGLPSGTLWATCNVGANAPEEYGDYYAWGETATKTDYSWATYQHCENGSSTSLTKYCNHARFGLNGYTDTLTVLEPGDDAATANWCNDWRMPTYEEWGELLNTNNTTNIWTTQNGVNGRLFTSKANGNTLFLPAAGFRSEASLDYAGSYGCYWSSSLDTGLPNFARNLSFYSGNFYMSSGNRFYGFSVRAVRKDITPTPVHGG